MSERAKEYAESQAFTDAQSVRAVLRDGTSAHAVATALVAVIQAARVEAFEAGQVASIREVEAMGHGATHCVILGLLRERSKR